MAPDHGDDFSVLPNSTAVGGSIKSVQETNDVFGLEMFATVAAARALVEQLRGERIALLLDDTATAGA